MARDHARIFVSVWSDPDFRELTVPAQHAYFQLLTQPSLSYCGVIDYLPNRLSKLSAKSTQRSVNAATGLLEDRGFIVRDDDTGELLIRTFVRHDGLLAMPNMTKAMAKAFLAVLSPCLREVITEELRKAYKEAPDLGGWKGLRDAAPALHSIVSTGGSRNG